MDHDTPTPSEGEALGTFDEDQTDSTTETLVGDAVHGDAVEARPATPDKTASSEEVNHDLTPQIASTVDNGPFAPTTEEFPAPEFDDDPDSFSSVEVDDHPIVTPVSDTITPASEDRHKNDGALYLVGALVAAVLGSLLTLGILALTGAFDSEPVAEAPEPTVIEASAPQIINELGSAVNPTAIAERVIPSIVTVNIFEEGVEFATGSGSGVVMSNDGYIITNHHVIDDAGSISVAFDDGRQYDATLIGSDDLTDLAVLQIDADGLVPIEFGSTDDLLLGDPAVAIGNPLGQDGGSSITAGIVSAFDRRVDFSDGSALFGMIQTDAAINQGSSGGALVDADGDLIGITSAIGVSNAGPEGIGYAIPIELVDRITSEIIETGDVQHPFLGVTMRTYYTEAADGAVVPGGAIIESLEGETSAARAAGVEPGDVVVEIEGDTITDQTDLILKVRLYRVGDTIAVTVDRGGELVELAIELGLRPQEFQG